MAALPIHTTLVTVRRPTGTGDAFDAGGYTDYRRGLRAHISSPSGRETVQGGSSSVKAWRLNCDPVELRHQDRVYDESTGITYEVTWAAQRVAFGLDHSVAELLVVNDRAAV